MRSRRGVRSRALKLSSISRELSRKVDLLRFAAPVAYVYNPLDYARDPHEAYLERYGRAPKRVLLVGMNPGPFGMAQTGVPFGDPSMVRQWLKLDGRVKKPRREHPKRPIAGFDCERSEVSGKRLWGWAEQRFRTPERFFRDFFVANYCPLVFMEESGRNLTPDKLPASTRQRLFDACDEALARVIEALSPEFVVGIGNFAQGRARQVLGTDSKTRLSCILHPSPASPKANKNWAETIERQLADSGIELPR